MSGRKRSSRIADGRNELAIRAQQGKADLTSLRLDRVPPRLPNSTSADAGEKSPYNGAKNRGMRK